MMFEKMVLAGVGLICGSLALDMRRHRLVGEIIGYGRGESNLKLAKKKGIIDSYFLRPDEFPGGVDFLMMGTPVETIVPSTSPSRSSSFRNLTEPLIETPREK